jgi:hypothetical protein
MSLVTGWGERENGSAAAKFIKLLFIDGKLGWRGMVLHGMFHYFSFDRRELTSTKENTISGEGDCINWLVEFLELP